MHEAAVAPPAFHLAMRSLFRGTPVWAFRWGMDLIQRGEEKRMNVDPIAGVVEVRDIDYVGAGLGGAGSRSQRLDVLVPERAARAGAAEPVDARDAGTGLPVYVYLHGGGWTSGDKATVTKYCAHQAATGMVVVNVNYRRAGRFQMNHLIEDADAAMRWVHEHVGEFGGDPDRVVLGGDSAGGHIAALYTSASGSAELRRHFGLGALPVARVAPVVRGLVLHCSAVDFSMLFERAPILSRNFVRLLHPRSTQGPTGRRRLRADAAYLSPIEWVGPGHPEVFVTTSVRDYFYESNVRFVERLRGALVPVETLVFGRESVNARHTWQQNYRYPESQTVYERLTAFINRVTDAPAPV